ncbi:glycosyltransferase family 4 protein [Marinobacterium sediminicola]|uniref:Glycosyltransferase involved in cell wall bisynthesis n=1 Tax=Marinobacterium sediminicola TaxID=518898 RepID=A0ABY1RZF4_9GAMM|nr:glycosyltransferase family 4 protein [Marinobacterium sediminicola]ULG69104.1 glycosyltransferase family 4 protein [Marinobacterium sediminicola]SMR73618.1 Glycosyltransferase involved in cell wall bisynthesis [Marinobacterium sediminicola]
MKVVQVLPALELGGVERGTLEIARGLVAAGHESVVVSAGGRLVEQLEREGSRHVSWELGRKSLLTFLQAPKFRRWLAEEKPDIVHVRSRMPAWVVWLAWRKMDPATRPRFVTTLHGMHSVNRYSAVMGKGEKVIAVSETAKQYLLENYPEVDPAKVTVIHRGIDPDEFPRGYQPSDEWKQQFYSDYPQAQGKRLVCFPGRITRWKGHLDLVNVVARLSQQRQDFHVLIVGSDPKDKFIHEVRAAITEAGLEAYFSFLGTRSDMKNLYAISDVMLSLTSTTAEAFGRTVVECLSIGTPVVGYAYGAVAETLTAIYPQGKVVVGDVEGAVQRVSSLLSSRDEIRENPYVLSNMINKTIWLYEGLECC